MILRFLLLLLTSGALISCGPRPRTEIAFAEHKATPTAPDAQPVHIDSFIPRDEALRRFRRGLAPVDSLTHARASREALVSAFVSALEQRDTATLGHLVLSRAEFAYLYYPTSRQSLPQYDLNADLMWFMTSLQSDKGAGRALEEIGGQPLRAVGHRCADGPAREGRNTIWAPCGVRRVRAPGDTVEERLFGPIIERDGRYKFLSYVNKL